MTGIGSVLHFLVDGLCVCCLYLMVAPYELPHQLGIFMTYTVMAFATQPLTGWWADMMHRKHWMLLWADVLLALGMLASSVALWWTARSANGETAMFAAASLLGLGNSLFHVWGGKQTALTTGNDIRALGVFVSTGAFGLAVGGLFFSWTLAYVFLLLICGLSLTVAKGIVPTTATAATTTPQSPGQFSSGLVWAAMLGLMVFVMFRSSVSSVFSFGLDQGMWMILAVGFTSMLGKMLGGWLSCWLGLVRALVLVLLLVGLCWV